MKYILNDFSLKNIILSDFFLFFGNQQQSVTKIYITKPQQIRLLNTLYIATLQQ